jgi:hypothetical protein
LSSAFSKKINHISRLNTFGNHKIVINSPEVYFGIKRQHPEVGNKNLVIFGYKNHLDRFCRNRKHFLERFTT